MPPLLSWPDALPPDAEINGKHKLEGTLGFGSVAFPPRPAPHGPRK
jgi:hypothetical protein